MINNHFLQLQNARVFGRPSSYPGTQAAFPKVRLVILVEAGTHIIFDALMCPYCMGERVRALRLLRSVTSEMLLMWDRGLHSYAMVQATVAKGCDYLGRIPANVKFLSEKPTDTFKIRFECVTKYCSFGNLMLSQS